MNKTKKVSIAPDTLIAVDQALKQYNNRLFRSVYRDIGYRIAHELITGGENQTPGLLSVIVPVYGNVNVGRLETCLLSLKRQRGVPVEIVLAEQTFDTEKYKDLAKKLDVLYVSDHLKETHAGRHFNSGRIRNVAIEKSSGQFIYASDSDILYQDQDYMAKIVQLLLMSPDVVLEWPRMKHLVMEEQEVFYKHFAKASEWSEIVPGLVSHGEWALGYKSHAPIDFRQLSIVDRRMIIREEDFESYTQNLETSRGWEPRWLLPCRHDGAFATRRSQIDMVGGYAECFYHWGYEDYDLQWKLSELFCVVSIEGFPDFEVTHMDHEKGWFDKLLFERNGNIHWTRREKGIAGAIITDVLENKSPYGIELKKRWHINLGNK